MGDWSVKDQAIYNTHPNVVEIIDSKDCFDKDGKPVTLDDTKVATELARLKAEWDNQEYARKREKAYPSIKDQLDDLYHNGIDGWKATIKITKDKYPKE